METSGVAPGNLKTSGLSQGHSKEDTGQLWTRKIPALLMYGRLNRGSKILTWPQHC